MDFTEIYKQTGQLVSFSPGAHFLLTAIQDRLVVRRTDSFHITRSWQLHPDPSPTASAVSQPPSKSSRLTTSRRPPARAPPDGGAGSSVDRDGWITHAGWSCDSEYILAACARKGVVDVFKMRDEEWRARIEAGAEGLVKAEWAPDGRSIVCWSEWGLRVTVWSLVTDSATYIQYPAHPERGYAFRSDGHYLILAERHKSKDAMGVYDATSTYRMVRHFPLPTALFAALSLSPTGNHVAVWEGPLEHKIYILSLAGELLGTFTPEKDPTFGVRAVAWHPVGLFLVVLGWDDKVYVLENLTWGPVATFELQSRIPTGTTIWREPLEWLEATGGRGFLSYERVQAPHTLTLTPRDRTKPPSELSAATKSSCEHLAWNIDGTTLMVRYGGAPEAIWLYVFPSFARPPDSRSAPPAVMKPKLRSVLLHASAVTSAVWNPVRKASLVCATGGGAVYLWSDEWVSASPEGEGEAEEVAECVGVPARKFAAGALRWAPDGRGLVLLDRETFCCAFEVEEEAGDVPVPG
ncbi:YVTN repeat-like/Quino protein amine dehydrogenase [Rhodofomes roseus]|uniref:YVTN repeat-like/Quino protein amine dehydrogenase n=1 Tax=Rhodofomes roseus TaxID=34475 RepID=A0ABQ8KKW4_9APHY|nr:YVTN repeat-like/Quino protein amine dehydrogenase [Rhodofomes roseus]KAH9838777.1 YVTN repeat-like/Quino protein amine dehydrogenase [Rhodofomes roseus]